MACRRLKACAKAAKRQILAPFGGEDIARAGKIKQRANCCPDVVAPTGRKTLNSLLAFRQGREFFNRATWKSAIAALSWHALFPEIVHLRGDKMANGITSARMPTLMFVPCRIQRGGFSSERTFEIREGDKSSMGTADVDYLRDGSWNHLDEDEPDENVVIEGYVQCKVLRTVGDDQVLIEVPGAKTVYATKADLVAPD